MTTGYWLYDHPNFNAPVRSNGYQGWFHPERNSTSHAPSFIVVHTAENIPDIVPPDTGAESIAHYFTINARPASAHVVVDTDSTIPLLPDTAVAFHVIGYNALGWGIEIATQAAKWADLPPEFANRLMLAAAKECARVAEKYNIPVVFRTKAEIDKGLQGFTGHTNLDPARRSDPGFSTWQWRIFLAMVEAEMAQFDEATAARLQRIADADKTDRTGEGQIFYSSWQAYTAAGIMTADSDPIDLVSKQELVVFLERFRKSFATDNPTGTGLTFGQTYEVTFTDPGDTT